MKGGEYKIMAFDVIRSVPLHVVEPLRAVIARQGAEVPTTPITRFAARATATLSMNRLRVPEPEYISTRPAVKPGGSIALANNNNPRGRWRVR